MKQQRQRRAKAAALLIPFITAGAAWAQDTTGAMRPRLSLLEGLLGTIVFGIVGILLAILGFKLFDVVIRHNVEKEIFENNNMAAALLAGAVILGVSIIVAATILS